MSDTMQAETPHVRIVPAARAAWALVAARPGAAIMLAVPALTLGMAARIARRALWSDLDDAALTQNVVYFFVNMNLHILAFAVAMPLAAAWHRLAAAPDDPTAYRISDTEWGYLWRAVGLFMVVYVGAIFLTPLFGLMHGHLAALAGRAGLPAMGAQALSLPVYALLAGSLLRLGLVLPAAACERPIGFPAAWAAGRGNTWRLAGAAALAGLPVAAAWMALDSFAAPASLGPLVVREALNVALAVLSLVLAAGLLSAADEVLGGPEI